MEPVSDEAKQRRAEAWAERLLQTMEAEQELQEGPLTEYSGRSLALMKWGVALKQLVALTLFIGVFMPFGAAVALSPVALGLGVLILLIKLLFAFIAIAFVENTMARNQFLDVSRITFMGAGAALLAFALSLARVSWPRRFRSWCQGFWPALSALRHRLCPSRRFLPPRSAIPWTASRRSAGTW